MNMQIRSVIAAAAVLVPLISGCTVSQPSVPANATGPTAKVTDPAAAAALATAAAAENPAARASPSPASPGEAVYRRYCAACHGVDGIAVASAWTPNLNSQGLLAVVDDAFLYDSTVLGRPGENGRGQPGTKMSAYEGILSEEDLQAVVTYLRRWQSEPSLTLEDFTADGDVEAGRRIYDATCTACHGHDGWGDLAPRLAGEAFHSTYSDAHIRHVILHGRPGTRMPPHLLSDEELNDLVTFVRTLGQTEGTPETSP